jgi:cobalt/nickel transport system permease protein
MHMPNELLSLPVAAGGFAVAFGGLGFICSAARKSIAQDKIALMGIFGAFIFAAQMVNFPLPFGASGHMTGGVFLAIVFGPAAAAVVMTSVVVIQCLIFQDGGLLALGCNIINLAIIPSFLGFTIYRAGAGADVHKKRIYAASIIASIVSMVAAAAMVSVEAGLSGVLSIPFVTFLSTVCGIHFVIGIIEGAITAALLLYLRQTRPDVILESGECQPRFSMGAFIGTTVIGVLICGACLSLLASEKPDGLEYSLVTADSGREVSVIENDARAITVANELQGRIAPLPDYTRKNTDADAGEEPAKGWTSFAAVVGSLLVMLVVWVCGKVIKPKGARVCTTQ